MEPPSPSTAASWPDPEEERHVQTNHSRHRVLPGARALLREVPDLFESDEEGRAVIIGDGVLPESIRERDVASVCPEAAIILV